MTTTHTITPRPLADVLDCTTPRGQSTTKRTAPGAPRATAPEQTARALFVISHATIKPKIDKKKKKTKKMAKSVAAKSKAAAAAKTKRLPKMLYLVIREATRHPVSVHRTALGAERAYWKEVAQSGEELTIVACPSGKD